MRGESCTQRRSGGGEDKEPTDEINDSVRDTESAGSLDTTTNILDLRSQSAYPAATACASLDLNIEEIRFPLAGIPLQLFKVLPSQPDERRADVLSDQLPGVIVFSVLGYLDLQLATAELEIEELLDITLRLGHLIAPSNSKVHPALTNEGRNISRRQEDKGDLEVNTQRDVEARVAVELDVTAVQKVKTLLVKTSL